MKASQRIPHWHALQMEPQGEFDFWEVATFPTRKEASRFARENGLPAVARCTHRHSPEAIEYWEEAETG